MAKLPSLTLVSFLLLVLVVPTASFSAQISPPFDGCDLGVFAETGAEWAICMPEHPRA